ncbi:outer membrane lipoprotein carrier protein [Thioalkalivibrio sp. ALE21]|nr:outer membrane lipoprotein carrier protein [Thioalkalivibrio sp. ALE21]
MNPRPPSFDVRPLRGSSMFPGLVAALLLLFAAPAGAADDARLALERFMAGLETFSAEFTQTVSDETGFTLQESEGVMHLGLPDRLYWEVHEPFPQVVVSDGRELWTFEPDLAQATVRPLGDALEATPIAAISQPDRLEEHFRTLILPVPDGEALRLLLLPRDEHADFVRMMLDLTPDGDLVRMQFEDLFGQVTDVRFSASERNPELDPDTFRFEVPDGADVYRP